MALSASSASAQGTDVNGERSSVCACTPQTISRSTALHHTMKVAAHTSVQEHMLTKSTQGCTARADILGPAIFLFYQSSLHHGSLFLEKQSNRSHVYRNPSSGSGSHQRGALHLSSSSHITQTLRLLTNVQNFRRRPTQTRHAPTF